MCLCVFVCLKHTSPEWALAAAEVAAREDDFTDEDSEIDSDGDGDGSSNYDKVTLEREW